MGKYDKYFVETLPGSRRPEWAVQGGPTIAYLDDKLIKGCYYYSVEMFTPAHPLGLKWGELGHGPHAHKDAELLMHLGTNPDDPTDLGAEVDLYMGPEMEKHVITKSCVVYFPPGFVHCPWIIKRIDRPWLFVEVNQGPMHTEKSYPQIMPEKDREKMLFLDEGYGTERKVIYPKGVNIPKAGW
jgi:hypothetical protein